MFVILSVKDNKKLKCKKNMIEFHNVKLCFLSDDALKLLREFSVFNV